jgi:hypothetical protein
MERGIELAGGHPWPPGSQPEVQFARQRLRPPDESNSWMVETPDDEIVAKSRHFQIRLFRSRPASLPLAAGPEMVPVGVAAIRSSPGQARHLPPSMPAPGRGRLNRDRGPAGSAHPARPGASAGRHQRRDCFVARGVEKQQIRDAGQLEQPADGTGRAVSDEGRWNRGSRGRTGQGRTPRPFRGSRRRAPAPETGPLPDRSHPEGRRPALCSARPRRP